MLFSRGVDHPPPEAEDDPHAHWPERLVRLGQTLGAAGSRERREALGEFWGILHLALLRYARAHARRIGRLSPDDVLDIVSEKASDLIARLDLKEWDPGASTPALLRSFLSTTARNGVVDALRAGRREVLVGDDLEPRGGRGIESATQEDAVRVDEFVRALLGCLAVLSARARRAWFLRVFYDFSSAEIARHPDVSTSPAGVDAMLARCREHVRSCMNLKGIGFGELPAGTFVRLWELTERDRAALGAGR